MARSLKKGPFADESLLKKVDAMNASGNKSVIAKIVDDEDMPYYYDDCGNKVTIHLLKNMIKKCQVIVLLK